MRLKLVVLVFVLGVIPFYGQTQNVGINSTGAAPDGGAGLDVSFTNKGLLIPRVNITDLTTIAPITGSTTESMLVYNTNTTTGKGYYYWNGTEWVPIGSDGYWDRNTANGYLFPTTISDRVGIGMNTPEAMLHVVGGPSTTGTTTSTITVELDNFASDGDTDSDVVSLPSGITSATVSIEVTGDMGSSTEFVNVFVGGTQIGGDLSDDADDCVYDEVVSGSNVTTILQGNGSITVSGNSSPATDEGFDCAGTAVKVKLTFTITHDVTIERNAIFESAVGIGHNNPQANLHIIGSFQLENGSQATGRVLTSDNNGVASWAAPSSLALDDGDWISGTGFGGEPVLYNITDSIGVGTANPDHIFDVDIGTAAGTELGIGSIEYFTDEANETTINNDFSPADPSLHDLGSNAVPWSNVFSDAFTTVSDRRLKTKIETLEYGLDEILSLKPVTYQWKKNQRGSTTISPDQKDTRIGFIAQEVNEVLYEVVKKNDWEPISEEDPENYVKEDNEYWGIIYSDMVPVLVKAIQEQQEIIEKQNEKYDALKKEVEELKRLMKEKE